MRTVPAKRPRSKIPSDPIKVADDDDDETPIQKQRKKPATRTNKLLDQARLCNDALQASGNFDAQLLRRWQCS
ncbi:MAG: hypothetical protein Q9212_003168, partial [Teloschistes hypoglaucus]